VQMTTGAVQEIILSYSGELVDVDTTPLTRYVVKGVLSHHLGSEQVNIVNSMHLAKTRGINITVQKSSAAKSFTNLVTVSLKTKEEETSISGTLLQGYGERVVQIGKYPVDLALEGNFLLISQIANMQVGRIDMGGSAIMILSVDKPVPQHVLEEIAQIPDINEAKYIII